MIKKTVNRKPEREDGKNTKKIDSRGTRETEKGGRGKHCSRRRAKGRGAKGRGERREAGR